MLPRCLLRFLIVPCAVIQRRAVRRARVRLAPPVPASRREHAGDGAGRGRDPRHLWLARHPRKQLHALFRWPARRRFRLVRAVVQFQHESVHGRAGRRDQHGDVSPHRSDAAARARFRKRSKLEACFRCLLNLRFVRCDDVVSCGVRQSCFLPSPIRERQTDARKHSRAPPCPPVCADGSLCNTISASSCLFSLAAMFECHCHRCSGGASVFSMSAQQLREGRARARMIVLAAS